METIVLQVTLTRPRINAMDLTDFNFLIIPTVHVTSLFLVYVRAS